MEKKLSAMPYAQAKVRMLSGCDHNELISYQTTVAAIRDGWLHIYGLYSATTRRHIGHMSRNTQTLITSLRKSFIMTE